jgi:hypothetical protein
MHKGTAQFEKKRVSKSDHVDCGLDCHRAARQAWCSISHQFPGTENPETLKTLEK